MANKLTVTINGKQYVTKPANEAAGSLKNLSNVASKVSTTMKVGLAAATALAVKEITAFAKASVTAASDAEETWNKYSVVFRDVMDDANEAMRSLSEGYGLSSQMAQQMLSDTGDLLSGFGFTQEAALSLSEQVNTLAVDLASFTNYSGGAEGASAALTKALLGERESIKSLGIAITEADIKQLAEDKGITGELDRQTKAMLTLELAVSQSANAIGDFERSQDSFANQSRILQANIDDLKVAIGNELLPTVTKIVSGFNDWFDSIKETKEALKELSEEIEGATGKDLRLLESTLGVLLNTTDDVVGAIYELSESSGVSVGVLYQIALQADNVDQKFKNIILSILDTKDAIVTMKEKFLDFSNQQDTTNSVVQVFVDELEREKVVLHELLTLQNQAISQTELMGQRYAAMAIVYGVIDQAQQQAIESAELMGLRYEYLAQALNTIYEGKSEANNAIRAAEVMGERYAALAKILDDPLKKLLKIWETQEAIAQADIMGQRYAAMAGGSGYTPPTPAAVPTFMDSIMGSLGPLLTSLDSISALLDPIGTILAGMMEVLGPVIDELLAPLVGILKIFGQLLGSLLVPVLQILTPIIEVLANTFIWLYNKILLPVGNGIIRVFNIVQYRLIQIINGVITVINWALGLFGVNISKIALNDINANQLSAIDTASLTTASGISSTDYSGSTVGSSTSVQPVTINIYQYYDGPVIGEGGMEQVGEFVTQAIQAYTGVGGKTTLVTA